MERQKVLPVVEGWSLEGKCRRSDYCLDKIQDGAEPEGSEELGTVSESISSISFDSLLRGSSNGRLMAGREMTHQDGSQDSYSSREEDAVSSPRSELPTYSDVMQEHEEMTVEEKFKSRYVRMGERLTDDLINAYCDRLQDAVNREVDGMLAMQYIMLEPGLIQTLIKGNKPICQVIYDTHRAHYLVVYRSANKTSPVILYDPIVPHHDAIRETLNRNVCQQLATLFRHLYAENDQIDIGIEIGLSAQQDCWSCGLRAIAHVTHIVLGMHPVRYEYDLESVRTFFSKIMDTPCPSRNLFKEAPLGQLRSESKSEVLMAKITRDGELIDDNRRLAGSDSECTTESQLDCTQSDSESPRVTLTGVFTLPPPLFYDTNSSYSDSAHSMRKRNDDFETDDTSYERSECDVAEEIGEEEESRPHLPNAVCDGDVPRAVINETNTNQIRENNNGTEYREVPS